MNRLSNCLPAHCRSNWYRRTVVTFYSPTRALPSSRPRTLRCQTSPLLLLPRHIRRSIPPSPVLALQFVVLFERLQLSPSAEFICLVHPLAIEGFPFHLLRKAAIQAIRWYLFCLRSTRLSCAGRFPSVCLCLIIFVGVSILWLSSKAAHSQVSACTPASGFSATSVESHYFLSISPQVSVADISQSICRFLI